MFALSCTPADRVALAGVVDFLGDASGAGASHRRQLTAPVLDGTRTSLAYLHDRDRRRPPAGAGV